MPFLIKGNIIDLHAFKSNSMPMPESKLFRAMRKAHVKHQWYIKNKRGGDETPKDRGRPFGSKIEEIVEVKPKKTKMTAIEKRRRAIERNLKKIEDNMKAFREKLIAEGSILV